MFKACIDSAAGASVARRCTRQLPLVGPVQWYGMLPYLFKPGPAVTVGSECSPLSSVLPGPGTSPACAHTGAAGGVSGVATIDHIFRRLFCSPCSLLHSQGINFAWPQSWLKYALDRNRGCTLAHGALEINTTLRWSSYCGSLGTRAPEQRVFGGILVSYLPSILLGYSVSSFRSGLLPGCTSAVLEGSVG